MRFFDIETKKDRIMKKYISLILLTLIFGSFFSCEEEFVYTPDERFVLQAYLYANEPIWDIKIKSAVPLTVVDSVGESINTAVVTLYKNDVAYALVSNSDTGTYNYPGDNLIIEAGDEFLIEASVNNNVATGITTVPESPQGTFMSSEIIKLPEIDIDGGTGGFDFGAIMELREAQSEVELEVIWDNPNAELHFVVIENAEDEQESIFPDFGGGFGRLGGRGAFRRISAPTRESSYEIDFSDIQYWGNYIVKVYRVNQEYADLYENLEQDSRDLNEPPTNVKNGLGIFSAFNSENVYFEVIKE